MKQSQHRWSAVLASIIASALLVTSCGGGSGGDDLTLSGTYSRGGFVKAGASSAWAALGEASYQTDGTGTLSYAHSAFGPISGMSIAYGLDVIGTLLETISLPGAAGENTNGAVTSDKEVMVVIDDDEEDGIRGIEVGVRLSSNSVEPTGDYFHVGFFELANGNGPYTVYAVGTFNGDGTGTEVFEASDRSGATTSPYTYAVSEGGRLSISYEIPGEPTFTLLGATTSDKSVITLVDNDASGSDVGIEVAIKKSSGMDVSSIQGKYHLFTISSWGGHVADTAVIDFDGAGKAVITGQEGGDPTSVVYTVADDGALRITANFASRQTSWKGALREDGSLFAAADMESDTVGMVIGVAEWEQ